MKDYKLQEKLVGAGILPICHTTNRVLLCRRGAQQSNPLEWASWGGGFELGVDTTIKDCAKREFWEETRCKHSYKISNKPILIVKNNQFRYYMYAAMFNMEWIPDIEPEKEASGWGWFYLDDLPGDMIKDLDEFFNKDVRIVDNLIRYFAPR
jgi:ADP-ribose pyrophosphatase YjhB (NUDIX family)